MSYNNNLQSNNIDLQAILDTVNALPDAGGGSGDVGVIPVTLNINTDTSVTVRYFNAYNDPISEIINSTKVINVARGILDIAWLYANTAIYTTGEYASYDMANGRRMYLITGGTFSITTELSGAGN